MKYLTRPAEGPAKTLSDDPLETPPVFQTGDPQEAVKEVIRRTQGQVPGIRVSPGVSFNPLGTAEDQDPSLTGRFGVGGGELEFGVKEDEGFIGFRKQFDEGGVIGEDGMFEGTDLGTREGFAEIKTKGVIKLRDLAKLFEEYGINLNARNIASKAKTYGLKRPNKVQVAYKDRESTRIVDIKNPKAFYIKPTASELKQIKKQYDVNVLKKTSTGPGKVAFDKRVKRANQLLKSKKYTINQVNEILKSEFPEVRTSGMKSTLTKLAKNIKGIPSGREGETATIVKRVKDDLNKLNKSEVKKLLKAGDTNLEKLVNKTSKLLNIDKDLATRRIGQLIQAYAGDDLYLQVKDDLLLRRAKPILKALGNIEGTKLFGGIPGGLQRVRAERQFAKNIGKQDAFLSSLRKRIQELIPGSGYQTDEIKNVRSSVKFGTSPYSIFIQGIRSDINQDKVSAIDKKISTYEKRLQNAKTITEKQKIASKFNEEARAFVSKYNKNLKPGQLPVRALEISFKKPNEVIKNKSALANYGDMFDDIYKKHGYSFKVPSDIKTVDEILPFLKGGRGQKQVLRGIQTQAPRLFSGLAALPEMGRIGKEMITQDVPKFGRFAGQVARGAKGTLKLAGKGARMLVGPVELPLTIAAGGLYANYQNQLDFAKALDRTNLSENKKNDLKNKFRRAELGLDVGVGEEILVDTMGTESDIIGGIKDPDKIAQYQKVAFDAINAERDIQAEKLEQLRKEAQTIEVDEDFDVL